MGDDERRRNREVPKTPDADYDMRSMNNDHSNHGSVLPPRDFSAAAPRILIIGLDGATFDVLNPLMAEGRMPRLKQLVDAGASGPLRSTTPPITPAAWTTFLTGKTPGRHGILDFERYDPRTNRLSFNSAYSLRHMRNLWHILGERGLKIGSVNVPMTFPAFPVNGFLVSGFETPGVNSAFVFPPELKDEIVRRWPDPTLRSNWRRKTFGGDALFARNLNYMSRSFHQGTAMTTHLGDRYGWDALMVVFKLVDNLQHKAWKYIDPRWADRSPARRDMVKQCFAECDRAVGDLVDYAEKQNAAVMIVSDHGHGSLEGKVQPNRLLLEWGYLTLSGAGARGTTRGQHLVDRLLGRTKKFYRSGDILHDLAVDFSQTCACIMHAGMAGFLYLNLKGRQPCGIVSPDEYESLRDELRARFLGPECQIIDPSGRRIAMFSAVYKPEELYNCTRAEQPWMPDLILIPHESLAVIRKIRGSAAVKWLPYGKIEGTHRPDGVFIAAGPGIAPARVNGANIVDCAPTILALLGYRIPDDMEGKVLFDIFASPPVVQRSAPVDRVAAPTPTDDAFSDDDLDKVTERLKSLGYLE